MANNIKDFEKKLKRLEEIVARLEMKDLSLDETVLLFKEGVKLSDECKKTLSTVELSITEVINTTDVDDTEF